jgi:radical SAM superfamily enzyme YgiQ (UPF0313 family)
MKDLLLVLAGPKNKNWYINSLPPAGILYLAAYLEKNGCSVDVVDCNVSEFPFEKAGGYRVISFSVNIANIENSASLIRKVRAANPRTKIIAGGPLPTVSPETFFSLPLDAIFISESERSLCAYMSDPENEGNKGYYSSDPAGNWRFNGPAGYISDLDELPFPALDKINMRDYYTPVKKASPVSVLISSRGCPFKCSFCCKTMGNEYRARSAENVADEIEWQVKKLGVREIAVYDDNFTLDERRVERICALIRKRNIKVSLQLTNGVRADRLNFGLLKEMKAAGFWMVAFAPESANALTLEKINKGFELDAVKKCLSWCRKLGIRTWAFFIVGFPWEDGGMFRKTVEFASAIDADIVHFTNCVPLPGTELYRHVYGKEAAWPCEDTGFFCESRFAEKGLTARAYRSLFFRNPARIFRLLRVFSPVDLAKTAFYALRSGNILPAENS